MPRRKNSDVIRVRMYNVGFGDCFLIRIPQDKARPLSILIDCGSIAKASMSMPDIVRELLAELSGGDGRPPRLDVVVCTHRHADHVSGFADPSWADVEVGEVWFPWTENPNDPEATRIRETQSRLAVALNASWLAVAEDGIAAGAKRSIYELVAANAMSNDKAMTMLHSGIRSRPKRRFLGAAYPKESKFETPALPGVVVHVLGPSKSDAVIRDMDPPAGRTYLNRLRPDGTVEKPFEPFGEEWVVPPNQFRWSELMVGPKEQDAIRRSAEDADPAITVALDKAVNGTSLVLAFEVGEAVLLFPGDAQWGTWKGMLENPETRELVARSTFFKVGHHGSHNATPKEFVRELFRAGCCTMMSTRSGKWKSIPRLPLIDALLQKTNSFARSDEFDEAPAAPFVARTQAYTEAEIQLK